MMYRHTMTVYNSSGGLVATIPDTVDLSQFGIAGHPGLTHGAPVEAAFTPDAKYAYVSNYSMYGVGEGPEGSDTCTPASAQAAGDTPSYVYRVNTSTLAIDQVIQVGLVPKFLQVTPDGRYVLVANWCSWNLSIIDVAQAKVVATLPMGAYPRGIAISPDSSTAYVAIMGGDDVVKVNLATLAEEGSFVVGENPRHLVMDPAGRYLYASLNAPGEVVKVDLTDDQVVGSTAGRWPYRPTERLSTWSTTTRTRSRSSGPVTSRSCRRSQPVSTPSASPTTPRPATSGWPSIRARYWFSPTGSARRQPGRPARDEASTVT
jgi:YVTN family beta-propeller protein